MSMPPEVVDNHDNTWIVPEPIHGDWTIRHADVSYTERGWVGVRTGENTLTFATPEDVARYILGAPWDQCRLHDGRTVAEVWAR